MEVLDLFSAAAGGWSLGMHRAGFTTIAACEAVAWRRILYAENNPEVRIYDDVRTLTADQLVRDLGRLPSVIVGSPPCQDISSANTKGKGVDGARSGLYFEAARLVGDCRPRWFAFENSANLRTRGADRVLGALEALGYACWPFVVRARDVGANHERSRSWIIGCDPDQLEGDPLGRLCRGAGAIGSRGAVADPVETGCGRRATLRSRWHEGNEPSRGHVAESPRCVGETADADQARRPNGRMVAGLRSPTFADDGCGDERRDDVADTHENRQSSGAEHDEMDERPGARGDALEPWAGWNGGLAGHLRVDDGLSARLAGTRVALRSGRGTSAAALIVEAFGDAVVPQIPEAIGRAFWRVERAYAELTGAA